MPDRFLSDTVAGEPPAGSTVQEIIEAESGKGAQGINRRWQASDSARLVLISDAGGVKISRDNGTTAPTNIINDGTTAGGSLAGTYPSPSLSAAGLDAVLPPGLIMAWATNSPAFPPGWLPCNGAALSRTIYVKLFNAIGTTWGNGDGSGATFSLPDLQGKVLVGAGGAYPFASSGGADSVAGPAHTHTGSHAHTLNAHTHTLNAHTHALGTHTHAPGSHTHDLNAHTHDLSNHAHTLAGHTHAVDLDHNHGSALAAAGATATASNSILNGTGASTSVPAATHTHPVDLPALGGAAKTSDGPIGSNTSTLTGASTLGTPAGALTAAPSAASTGGPTGASDGPSTPSTDIPSTPNTQADSSAPAATASTISTLQRYAVAAYIIRVG